MPEQQSTDHVARLRERGRRNGEAAGRAEGSRFRSTETIAAIYADSDADLKAADEIERFRTCLERIADSDDDGTPSGIPAWSQDRHRECVAMARKALNDEW